MARPFVKWVGGKSQLLLKLLEYVPEHFGEYWEPMVGGGALFWKLAELGKLKCGQVILSDANPYLINAYQQVQEHIDAVLAELDTLRIAYGRAAEDTFYEARTAFNKGREDISILTPLGAAYFIFLKQTAFNGLWRVNSKGEFNAPWGHYTSFEGRAENLRECSMVLRKLDVAIQVEDVSQNSAAWFGAKGGLVYFDPPYADTFTAYNVDGFTPFRQSMLIARCGALQATGMHVLYTNADTPEVRASLSDLWSRGVVITSEERRSINSRGTGRGAVKTLIVHS